MPEQLRLHISICSRRRIVFLFAGALFAVGCGGGNPVTSDQWTWLWFAVPFLAFGIAGGFIVYYRRLSQLENWDLRVEPREPSPRRIILWMWGTAGATILLFTTYNLLLSMDGDQKLSNIVLWLLGTVVGVALALFLGLRRAEPQPLPIDSGRR